MNTFRDFFKTKFISERAYLQFDPNHFERTYHEMAMPGVGELTGDVIKRPISIDKDDINFLEQFPRPLWNSALHQRYEMLHDAILNLHDKRMNMSFKELQEKIKNALTSIWNGSSNGWDSLHGDISSDVLERLRTTFTPEYIKNLGQTKVEVQKAIEDEAHKEAYEEVKSKSEEIEESPEPIEFSFGKKTIMAKPFLNRLYHKIERTKGLEHHSHSGLHDLGTTHGQYGYDLAFPRKDKKDKLEDDDLKTTRGVGTWPSQHTMTDKVGNLVNLNQHHVFGNLEIPPNAEWRVVMGGKGPMKDDWIWSQAVNKNYKKFYRQLTISGKFGTESEKITEANKLAKEAAMQDALSGKLISPKIPTVSPNGRPVVDEKGQPINPEKMKVRVEDGKLILPDVYLPHIQKKFIKKDENGQSIEDSHWVPILNPAHPFRQLGDDESDYIHDENGKSTGEIDKEALKDRMTGHPDEDGLQPYVRVEPDEYQKSGGKGHLNPASFHLNQNSKGKFFISRGDSQYEELYKKIFGGKDNDGMELITDKASGAQLYNDFRAGILRCSGGMKCGGAGTTERLAIRQSISSIHGIIVMHALNNLGDPKLLTKTGRIAFAESYTGQFAQNNLGDDTRRKRILDRKLKSVSRDSTTGDGEVGIGDSLDAQTVNKHVVTNNRGRGGRMLPTTNWLDSGNSSYNVEAFRQMATQMAIEAKEADSLAKTVAITPNDIEKIKNTILDRGDVIKAIKTILTKIYNNHDSNRSGKALDKEIEDEIKGWIDDGASTSQQVMAKFMSHPLVAAITGEKPQTPERQPTSPEAESAIELFKNSPAFKSIKELQGKEAWMQAKKIISSSIPGEPSVFVQTWANEQKEELNKFSPAILTSLQDFLDDEFDLNSSEEITNPVQVAKKPTPVQSQPTTSVAAREIERPATTSENPEHKGSIYDPNSASEHLGQLKKEKRWHDFINHPEFHIWSLNAAWYPQLQAKVNNWLQQGWITPAQQQAAQARIAHAMNMPRNEL